MLRLVYPVHLSEILKFGLGPVNRLIMPSGCASLSITSSAETSTDNMSASRTTSLAKSKSVKDSFIFPMVVPTMSRSGVGLLKSGFRWLADIGITNYMLALWEFEYNVGELFVA